MSKTPNRSFEEILAAVASAQRILMLSHARPDGDAIGSALGLALSLESAGKTVIVMNEDGVPDNLSFLPGSETVLVPDGSPVEADLVIALDTANKPRLGENCLAAAAGVKVWVNMDHHKTNECYGDLVHVAGTEPSTAQIVYEFLSSSGISIPAGARDCLFVGMSTDTGSFQYPSTNARSYEIVAEMIRDGLDVGDLSSKTYDNFPFRRLELLRELLGVLRLSSGNRCASWALTLETKRRLEVKPEDSEGLIDQLRAIEGVVVAVFFEELAGGTIRVSMRSKSPQADVSEICGCFGGGGHTLAAGARIAGELTDIEPRVLKKIEEILDDRES